MDLKLFQSDVAKIFRVSTDCLTYWENNRSNPQIIFYPKIIEFLGYSPLYFDETTLCGQIKAYRYKKGITSTKFGNLLKVDASTVTEWENGTRVPAPKHLLKLEILLDKVNKS
ncbi:helix-turn-helix domain-containing protein [Pedobacter sp. ASV12]|uniref:helix-turn-helix domain-containing protein n=1 Tax=Pedobacter sp. ASV12 TaxID=2795120 RepID=UPI001E5B2830|nr:helix-turn-helix transcriptional regulator [Pedobacter sp. ASV12]